MTAAATMDCNNNGKGMAGVLYMALELSQKEWKLGFGILPGHKPRLKTIEARDLGALFSEIGKARKKLGLPDSAPVRSCYEAGLDGFWIHRLLVGSGVENVVVDSSSIEVNRRFRRAKSDGLDVGRLLGQLMRYHGGEKKVWSVVRVPGEQDEADRQLHRELAELRGEQTSHTNRIKGLLKSCGLQVQVKADFEKRIEELRTWDHKPLPAALQERLHRECARLRLAQEQEKELERQREKELRQSESSKVRMVRKLMGLKGIGINSAWLWTMEIFGWRDIRNRRELGSLSGLCPSPYNSGESEREQGISKAGNHRVRTMAIEIAWSWLKNQPDSALSQWFTMRFAGGGKRMRRIGIVALARKLLTALLRYLKEGLVPQGAEEVDWTSKLIYRSLEGTG